MKISSILELDCRLEENKEKLQKVLKMIKPLSRYDGDVPMESLEKVAFGVMRKYEISIAKISPSPFANSKETTWHASIFSGKKCLYLSEVYGASLYEVMSKTVIFMYSKVKSGELKER